MSLATHKSREGGAGAEVVHRQRLALGSIGFLMLFFFFSAPMPGASQNTLDGKVRDRYTRNQAVWAKDPANVTNVWEFARACFDLADFATKPADRAALAKEGIDAAQAAIRQREQVGPLHYFLGLNLGQLARTKRLGALKLVQQMETEFLRAIELDAKFDYGGADRALGLLYLDAPGWPTSIGNKGKARQHLERALELAPDYPDNKLDLLEAWVKWGEKRKVEKELKPTEELLKAARTSLAGPEWEANWADWDKRWDELQRKARGNSMHRTD